MVFLTFRVEVKFFILFQGWGKIFFFGNISKQKKSFDVQAGPNYFFQPNAARQIIFSKSLSPPQEWNGRSLT